MPRGWLYHWNESSLSRSTSSGGDRLHTMLPVTDHRASTSLIEMSSELVRNCKTEGGMNSSATATEMKWGWGWRMLSLRGYAYRRNVRRLENGREASAGCCSTVANSERIVCILCLQ